MCVSVVVQSNTNLGYTDGPGVEKYIIPQDEFKKFVSCSEVKDGSCGQLRFAEVTIDFNGDPESRSEKKKTSIATFQNIPTAQSISPLSISIIQPIIPLLTNGLLLFFHWRRGATTRRLFEKEVFGKQTVCAVLHKAQGCKLFTTVFKACRHFVL